MKKPNLGQIFDTLTLQENTSLARKINEEN